jgi:hypothetical protein
VRRSAVTDPSARRSARSLARRLVSLTALVVLLVAAAPATSQAGTKTICRSVQNLLLFPLDMVLSPFVATKATFDSWRNSEDTKAVKYAYAPIAPIWSTSVELGASVIRGIAGALELLPGLVLIPFDREMNPLYDLPENQPAWVDQSAGPFKIRFGVDYVTPGE